jgi:xylulose-5-phosphate/fructose-6-phosphate phosphoketolase
MEALKRSRRRIEQAPRLIEECLETLQRHTAYVRQHFEDMPMIRDFVWGGA